MENKEDIKLYLTEEELEKIIKYIENNFSDINKLKNQLENAQRLSNFLKLNNYTIGEFESDKLLTASKKLNNMFNIIYLADKLVRINDFHNLSILLEIYSISTGHEQSIDIDDFSTNRKYGNKGLDILKVYFSEVDQYRLLTKEEEIELSNLGFEGRQKLIEHNLKLVLGVAKRYKGYELSYEDVIQAGNEGLIIAANKYDSNYHCRFSTYALWWIKQRIQREFAYSSRTIRIPYGLHEKIVKAKRIINSYKIENDGLEISDDELAQIMDISLQTVNEIRKSIELSKTSSYDKILEDEKNEIGEGIEDERNSITEKTNQIFNEELINYINGLDILLKKEKEVIKLRFGFYGEIYTLQEIADIYGVTRERVRQIEAKCLKKLYEKSQIQDFDDNFSLRIKKQRT